MIEMGWAYFTKEKEKREGNLEYIIINDLVRICFTEDYLGEEIKKQGGGGGFLILIIIVCLCFASLSRIIFTSHSPPLPSPPPSPLPPPLPLLLNISLAPPLGPQPEPPLANPQK